MSKTRMPPMALFDVRFAARPGHSNRVSSKSPFPGNGIFKPETGRARRLRSFEDGAAETKAPRATPGNSGLFAKKREISVSFGMRGGAERTRTPCQARSSIEPVSVTAAMLQARAHRAGAKVAPYAANPNQYRCRCTVRLDPAIKRRRTAQRHCRERTGNPLRLERYCRQFPGAKGAPRSCHAGSIAVAGLRWCGGRPRTERRISMSKSAGKRGATHR